VEQGLFTHSSPADPSIHPSYEVCSSILSRNFPLQANTQCHAVQLVTIKSLESGLR
jgi:hypothetical protein